MKTHQFDHPPLPRTLADEKTKSKPYFADNRPEALFQASCIQTIRQGTSSDILLAINQPAQWQRRAPVYPAPAQPVRQMQLKADAVSSSTVCQLAAMTVQITGITHLVRPIGGSIFEGEETAEVYQGMNLNIDTDRSIWSRRGPNQEVEENRLSDEDGLQIYEWYPVLSIDGSETPSNSYLRDETFIAPSELNISGKMKAEGEKAIERAKGKDEKKKNQKKKPPKSKENLLTMVFQSIGTTFEEAAQNFVVHKHPGCTIYASLKLGSKDELDFVVIQGEDVLIYSVKLNPAKVHPPTDLDHWNKIKAKWNESDGTLLAGTPRKTPPKNSPLILGLSPQTFGLANGTEFLELLVPNWESKLRTQS